MFQGNGLLLAYQIAFDLYENASQQFINKIEKALIVEPTVFASSETMQTDDQQLAHPTLLFSFYMKP